MGRRKKRDEFLLKSEVLLLIQNNIRAIQMRDYGSDEGVPQLYQLYSQVEKMIGCPVEEK